MFVRGLDKCNFIYFIGDIVIQSDEQNMNATEPVADDSLGNHEEDHPTTSVGLYVGLAIAIAALICVIFVVLFLGRRKFRSRSWSVSSRRLFIRGFSTVSQRGVLDSAASFEMVNTSFSVSSEDGGGSGKSPPKKPERRRTRTSTSTAKYENVYLDPARAGYSIRKSVSMNSDIPFMDGTVQEKKKEEDDLDEVFT